MSAAIWVVEGLFSVKVGGIKAVLRGTGLVPVGCGLILSDGPHTRFSQAIEGNGCIAGLFESKVGDDSQGVVLSSERVMLGAG